MKIGRKLRTIQDGKVVFNCPGCNSQHPITVHKDLGAQGPVWGYNNNPDAPTLTPSVLVQWKEPSDNPEEFDDETKDISKICHSFVTDGMIHYLGDCTHALAGLTVELPDMDDEK